MCSIFGQVCEGVAGTDRAALLAAILQICRGLRLYAMAAQNGAQYVYCWKTPLVCRGLAACMLVPDTFATY